MAPFVGPRCMIRCALALALGIACTPALAVAAPPSPATDGSTDKPGRVPKIPAASMPTTAPDMLMMADALVRGGHTPEARYVLEQVIAKFPNTGWSMWGY